MVTDLLTTNSWVLGPLFIILLIIVVWVRKRIAGGVDIKPIDAAIALIPLVLWMATAGILKKVEVPGFFAFEVADAIVNAAKTEIKDHVSPLPVKYVTADGKTGVSKLPGLLEKRTEALSFKLGYGSYYGPAIWKYLVHLNRLPSFRFVVVFKPDDSFFGMFDASILASALNPPDNYELVKQYPLEPLRKLPPENKVEKWFEFARRLRENDAAEIQKYPGFFSADQAVKTSSDKQQVLTRMEEQQRDWLPVVTDPKGEFEGIVERSRLTTSLILDIAKRVEAGKKEAKKN
jgi:hypothetical protein